MDSKQSMCKSATNCTEKIQGYSLKKQTLKKWIYENKFSQPYVAKYLGLTPEVFKQKLSERGEFSRDQLFKLFKLMGAKEAFRVIYFPRREERTRVFHEVFVDPLKEELSVK